jgi:hypothetical protein
MNARLSVFVSLKSGGTVVHVFLVSANATLDWFKRNADEMAGKFLPGVNYSALNVEAA